MPIVVKIDEDTRITSDPLNWMVQKFIGKEWRSKSWHPNYRAALLHLSETMIRESNAEDLAEALDRVEEVIDKLVEAHKDVIAPVVDDEGFLVSEDGHADPSNTATIELEVIEKPKGEPLAEEDAS